MGRDEKRAPLKTPAWEATFFADGTKFQPRTCVQVELSREPAVRSFLIIGQQNNAKYAFHYKFKIK